MVGGVDDVQPVADRASDLIGDGLPRGVADAKEPRPVVVGEREKELPSRHMRA